MLIFTLSAHRQQTPHDMGVVTAVSVCCRVCVRVCVREGERERESVRMIAMLSN